jgi:tRNA(fMet)-specific endonuclease VapC
MRMKYLLDTNVLISMFKNQHGIRERIKKVGFEACAISELTIAELYVGMFKGKNRRQKKEVDFVKNNFTIIPDSRAIETYAKIRAELESKGQKIDTIDCLIGSTAIVYDLIVVTNNTKHFERIPDIKLEDWQND